MYLTLIGNIALLGSSQTFLGFLGSLLVMCIIAGSSNFISQILRKIRRDNEKEIKKLDNDELTHPEYYINKADQDSDFYIVRKFLDNPVLFINNKIEKAGRDKKGKQNQSKKSGKKVEKLRLKALSLTLELYATSSKVKCQTSKELLEATRPIQDFLSSTTEQYLAPFYMLLYCLAIFFLDEIVAYKPESYDFSVSAIAIFTLLSVIFWVSIWICFVKGVRKLIGKDDKDSKKATKSKVYKYFSKYPVWKCIALLLMSFVVGYCIAIFFFDSGDWCRYPVFYLISIVMPLSYISYIFIQRHSGFGNFGYRFSARHFLMLLTISLIYSFAIWSIPELNNGQYSMIYIYDGNPFYIKMTMLIFVTINGLLMPYATQSWSIRKLKKYIEAKVDESKQKLEKAYTKIFDEIKKLSGQIKNLENA